MKTQKYFKVALQRDYENKYKEFQLVCEERKLTFPDDSEFLIQLKEVFAYSDFFAENAIKEPRLLKDLIKKGDLENQYGQKEYVKQLRILLEEVDSKTTLSLILRRFRLRQMMRIAWRDLAGCAGLAETMEDLTNLADACLQQALGLLYLWQCSLYGQPVLGDGSPQSLIIIGMGKLGARELNFSSDIDLIFAFPEAGETMGRSRSVTNEDFFVRLGRQLVDVIGAKTDAGLVFRVDLRLRPYGENGPLVMSFNAMEDYYQTQGRDWERYAWIKARIVAGSQEDGSDLLNRMKPFVFRRYLDFGAFDSLRDMKKKISLEIKGAEIANNIKLGSGGIREIEFFGQIFQLIRGGVNPLLQDQGIQKILEVLADEKLISRDVCIELLAAYEFLRNTEHRLQEFSDQQAHILPSDELGKERLASSMGFTDWDLFITKLEMYRRSVHLHFNNLLQIQDTEEKEEGIRNKLEELWLVQGSESKVKDILTTAGFSETDKALSILNDLRSDSATRAMSNEGRQRLDQLVPVLLKEIGLSDQSDLILPRIVDLIKTIGRRTCYISLLLENNSALKHLIDLIGASPWIASFLAHHPVLLDELLGPRSLCFLADKSGMEKDISRRFSMIFPDDLEYRIQELCIFKQINTLHVAAAEIRGLLPIMKVSDHLSDIAEVVLDQVLDMAWNYLAERHGKPNSFLEGKPCDKGFVVIAYGKLGGIELGYGSDLDLVFLHAGKQGEVTDGSRPLDSPQFYARLGQRVIHLLTAHTSAGRLYEVDMRLRPSGNAGLLVSHIEAFHEYQKTKAWTWEHQALIRARPIGGDLLLKKHFKEIRRDILKQVRVKDELQREIIKMRKRMRQEYNHYDQGMFHIKQSPGGMVDIEFIVQYLVLLNASEFIQLLDWPDNIRLLETLSSIGILDRERSSILKNAYLTYRTAAHRLSLQEMLPRVSAGQYLNLSEKIKGYWRNIFHDDIIYREASSQKESQEGPETR